MMKQPKPTKKSGNAVRATSRAEWNSRISDQLQNAVEEYDIASTDDWQPLDEISTRTEIEEIYVMPESTVFRDGKFFAPATVSVTLNYGGKRDSTSMSDSYPAEVEFTIEGNDDNAKIKIERIVVDTRSFYE